MRRTFRSRFPVAALMLLVLTACALGCGGEPQKATRLLESERRLAGMYEACRTIKLEDGGRTAEIQVSSLEEMPQVTVDAILKRSNGMTKAGTFTGVSLGEILNAHGVERPFDELKISAYDGYVGRVAYDIAVLPDTILALTQDGGPVPKEDGPTRLVVASQDGFYWVRMITGLEVLR